MGMGKSAADALPELRRKGISAGVSNFSMGGQILSAPEIAQALRLQVKRCLPAGNNNISARYTHSVLVHW